METTNSASLQPKISDGQDKFQVKTELEALIGNGWKLDKEQVQLEKSYNLKTYTKVLDLHTSIGIGSKAKNHHPEMITKAGSLTVFWTTHHPPGLSTNDTFMAGYCDEQAKLIGTVDRGDAKKCGPSG